MAGKGPVSTDYGLMMFRFTFPNHKGLMVTRWIDYPSFVAWADKKAIDNILPSGWHLNECLNLMAHRDAHLDAPALVEEAEPEDRCWAAEQFPHLTYDGTTAIWA